MVSMARSVLSATLALQYIRAYRYVGGVSIFLRRSVRRSTAERRRGASPRSADEVGRAIGGTTAAERRSLTKLAHRGAICRKAAIHLRRADTAPSTTGRGR